MSISIKKVIAAMLTAVMSLSVFTACGSKNGGNSAAGSIDLKNTTYKYEAFHDGEIEGDVIDIKRSGGKLYVVSSFDPQSDEEPDAVDPNRNMTVHVYSVNDDESDFKEMFSVSGEKDGMGFCVLNAAFAPDGSTYLIECTNSDEGEMIYSLEKFDPSGQSEGKIDPSVFDGRDIFNINCDKDGNVYAGTGDSIYVIDKSGNRLIDFKPAQWANALITDKDGNVFYSADNEGKMQYVKIDMASKGPGSAFTVENFATKPMPGSGDYDFYYDDGKGIIGGKYDGSTKMVMSWAGSNLSSAMAIYMTSFTNGNFLTGYRDNEKGGIYLAKFVKVDPKDVGDRQAVVYGGLWISESVKQAAIKFNQSQDKYQVIFHDYADGGYEGAVDRMNNDLLAGNIPDIIDCNYLHQEKFASKGMLMDLYELLDKDKEVKREDFLENALKAMETDGKLYTISPGFTMSVLAADGKVTGGKTTLTLDEIENIEKNYDVKTFGNTIGKTRVLNGLASFNSARFIDWGTGKCSFDTDEFVKILEYANSYPDDESIDYENLESLEELLKEGRAYCNEIYSFSFTDAEIYDKVFGGNAAFIGYPTGQGSGLSMNMTLRMGIYSKSPCADGAWEFVKYFLTREYGNNHSDEAYSNGFSTRKDVLEDQIKKLTATAPYTDDFGNEIEPKTGTIGYAELEMDYVPLTDEQIQKVKDVISQADSVQGSDDTVYGIIQEEAGAYFSGQKSAKEVAGLIQNRVSTYVNENK